jgi:peroxiredoxin
MVKRHSGICLTLGLLLAGSFFAPVTAADTGPGNLGKKVVDFLLKDQQGKLVSLSGLKDKKAVVVIFVGTECPINNTYMPILARLDKEYAAKGVRFLAINSNRQDTAKHVSEHAKKHGITFPVLKDEGNVIADRFGARRTPEAFILDAERKVCYQGRIDDQFGVGFSRPRPTRRDLVLALDEVLEGKKVSKPTTPVAGCRISRVTSDKKAGTVTFTKHIAGILQKNCQECHRPGQIGPMALLTYNQARNWAETVREVVADGRMPPWDADPRYGKFSNDRRLSDADKKTLLAWIDQGTPRGDEKDMPRARQFASHWQIGKPDVVITMPKAYEVPAEMPRYGIPYQHFSVETNFTEDRWVVRAEARPGSPGVVHHIVIFIVPPNTRFIKDHPANIVLCGTAPGDMPMILPPGMAKKIPKGGRLVFQMHYTPNGKAQTDRSSIGLIFAKKPPQREVWAGPVFNAAFRIPPGNANYKIESWYTLKKEAQIVGFMPHMHLRGKDFFYEAVYPSGKKEILLSVPRYNFNWQSAYRPVKPLDMPKGTRVHCVAHFDNSDKNPNNPDPKAAVYWGDQTWQEMMIGWTDFAFKIEEPKVKVTLLKAAAKRFNDFPIVDGQQHEELFIRCTAVLENSTKSDLVVKTYCYSAFDGMEIIVTDLKGKELGRRGYTDSQSPSDHEKDFPLKKGKTEKELHFFTDALPAGIKKIRVRLEGTLPGTKFKGELSSNTVEVTVKP